MADDAMWYADMIKAGKRKMEDVPEAQREAVKALMEQDAKKKGIVDALQNVQRWKKSGFLGQMPKGE